MSTDVLLQISNALELQREIQPYDARTLQGILALCQAAFSTKKSYIKRKSFPLSVSCHLLGSTPDPKAQCC